LPAPSPLLFGEFLLFLFQGEDMSKGGIENDFVFNNNVAGAGKMIRMGKFSIHTHLGTHFVNGFTDPGKGL
jgi:hypothetical protein